METAVLRFWFDAKPRDTSEAGIFTGDFVLDNFFWLDRIMEPYLSWSKASGGSAIEVHIYGPPIPAGRAGWRPAGTRPECHFGGFS